MKRIGIALLCLLMIMSCHKDNGYYNLIGTWELAQVSGGWSGIHNYERGNGNIVVFDNNGNYIKKVVTSDTAYTLSYHYRFTKSDGCSTNLEVITEPDNITYLNQAHVSNDSLFISDGLCVADGFNYVYLKK